MENRLNGVGTAERSIIFWFRLGSTLLAKLLRRAPNHIIVTWPIKIHFRIVLFQGNSIKIYVCARMQHIKIINHNLINTSSSIFHNIFDIRNLIYYFWATFLHKICDGDASCSRPQATNGGEWKTSIWLHRVRLNRCIWLRLSGWAEQHVELKIYYSWKLWTWYVAFVLSLSDGWLAWLAGWLVDSKGKQK